MNLKDHRQRYIHEFEGPEGTEFSENIREHIAGTGGRIINVYTLEGTAHIIVEWSTRDRAENAVRTYYIEAGVDDGMLNDMIADIHQAA